MGGSKGPLCGADDLARGAESPTTGLEHVRVAEDAEEHATSKSGDAVGVDDS